MDHTIFISLAYAAAGLLIIAICVSTWLRTRRVRRNIEARASDES